MTEKLIKLNYRKECQNWWTQNTEKFKRTWRKTPLHKYLMHITKDYEWKN